ncbi:MAG: prolipoprotein diacylglyceryl transferase, partial [Bacteroides sp.]
MYNTLNFITWNPDPEIFTFLGITIRYYSLLFATGLGLAY